MCFRVSVFFFVFFVFVFFFKDFLIFFFFFFWEGFQKSPKPPNLVQSEIAQSLSGPLNDYLAHAKKLSSSCPLRGHNHPL